MSMAVFAFYTPEFPVHHAVVWQTPCTLADNGMRTTKIYLACRIFAPVYTFFKVTCGADQEGRSALVFTMSLLARIGIHPMQLTSTSNLFSAPSICCAYPHNSTSTQGSHGSYKTITTMTGLSDPTTNQEATTS